MNVLLAEQSGYEVQTYLLLLDEAPSSQATSHDSDGRSCVLRRIHSSKQLLPAELSVAYLHRLETVLLMLCERVSSCYVLHNDTWSTRRQDPMGTLQNWLPFRVDTQVQEVHSDR